MSKLLAGHDIMEMGWNICTWIPAIRYLARAYKETIVVCKPGHEYLYRDFATGFEHYKAEGRTGLYGWYFRDKSIKMPRRIKAKYKGAKIVVPDKKICTKAPRKYFKYGQHDRGLEYDLVIHARSEVKFNRDNRNWPVGRYMKVLNALRNEKYISACSIGTKKGAYHIPGTQDLRGIEIEHLCNVLASSKLCIGVSSGPMHLASLCGCPHVVWTDNHYQKAIKGTNKDRYKTLWNPFGTRCKVIDKYGWRPGINAVYDKIKGFL